MLYWALVFLVIAIVAGLFGFGVIAGVSSMIAAGSFLHFPCGIHYFAHCAGLAGRRRLP